MPDLLSSEKGAARLSQSLFAAAEPSVADLLPRELFLKMLCIERDRAERSDRRLVLMLLESEGLLNAADRASTENIQNAICRATRDTDIKGWYRNGAAMGVLFTEIPLAAGPVIPVLSRRMTRALHDSIGAGPASRVRLSFHAFPDECAREGEGASGNGAFSTFYPDLEDGIEARRAPLFFKRCLDILGSLFALVLLAPLLVLIAAAIKLTSPGPVLFRQTRLGQRGKSFTFLKFRSMHAKSDPGIHEAYVKRFISNQIEGAGSTGGVYKLQSDPRITKVGRILRRTSLDEIPQFFSVLIGEMSLVGPRPPLPYEFAAYEAWHRRRLLAVKPGITGYWQVEGRSRVKFDEMVRMDIEYARTWSLWMDIKILLRTPRAVVSGSGAC